MADLYQPIPGSNAGDFVSTPPKGGTVMRYRDMGDGTFAPVLYVDVTGATITVPATMNQGLAGAAAWPVTDAPTEAALTTGATSTPLAAGALTAVAGRYMGIAVRETIGSAASVVLHDGTDATGPIIETIGLAAHQSVNLPPTLPGVAVGTGIFAVLTGTVEGAVRSL